MFLDNLSSTVLQLCSECQLTYETASERCGLSSRYFGDIARRKTAPSVNTLEKLCAGFQKTPNELLIPEAHSAMLFRRPMRVCRIHCFHSLHGRDSFPVCPQCGVTMEREYQQFCDRCGQCLDWSSYKHASIILLD